jgi:hypothetical protein
MILKIKNPHLVLVFLVLSATLVVVAGDVESRQSARPGASAD